MLQYIQKPSYYAFQVQNGRKKDNCVSSIVWNVRIHEERISQHSKYFEDDFPINELQWNRQPNSK